VAELSARLQTGGKEEKKEEEKEGKVDVKIYLPTVRVVKLDRQDQKVSNLD